MSRHPTKEEIQEIYKIYCQLATIIHDYAIGQQLYEEKCYSWAISANYYSLMHCGRFICLLGKIEDVTSHRDLHQFLSGQQYLYTWGKQGGDINKFLKFLKDDFKINEEELAGIILDEKNGKAMIKLKSDGGDFNLQLKEENGKLNVYRQSRFKDNSFSDLLQKLPQIMNNQETENKIKILGQKLEKIKKLRENNSYDFFIIAHQINHSVLKTEFPRVYEEIKKVNDDYLIFIFRLLIAYINSSDYKDYFIGFLKDTNRNHTWAFKDLINNLCDQNINKKLIREVEDLINENLMKKFNDGILLDDSFFNPITYDFHPDKYKKMKEFMERINDLVGVV